MTALRELLAWRRAWDRDNLASGQGQELINSRGYDPAPDLTAALSIFGPQRRMTSFWTAGQLHAKPHKALRRAGLC
jgi:hypothetical protein